MDTKGDACFAHCHDDTPGLTGKTRPIDTTKGQNPCSNRISG